MVLFGGVRTDCPHCVDVFGRTATRLVSVVVKALGPSRLCVQKSFLWLGMRAIMTPLRVPRA